jgi:hypothetical protein
MRCCWCGCLDGEIGPQRSERDLVRGACGRALVNAGLAKASRQPSAGSFERGRLGALGPAVLAAPLRGFASPPAIFFAPSGSV